MFKTAAVSVGLLLGLLCLSCGESDTSSSTITASTIELDSLDSWEGIASFIDDPTGDTDDAGVDIENVYFAHDDDFFYVRIDIAGMVDGAHNKELSSEISFYSPQTEYGLVLSAHLPPNEVRVDRQGNEDPPCYFSPQMMSYPGNDFLEWFDHSIVYKIRLSDIDFNINGTQASVRVSTLTSEDSTAGTYVRMDTTYLSSVTASWPIQPSKLRYSIPNGTITIDGDMTDWSNIDPVFEDRLDDVYHDVPSTNIQEVYIAQDADAYYFRIDLLQEPIITTEHENPQVRFQVIDSRNDRKYWFTAWFRLAGVVIQDISLFDINNPGADSIKEYPEAGYLSVDGSHIEYRVMKSDVGFDLEGGCINVLALIGGASDYTESVLIE